MAGHVGGMHGSYSSSTNNYTAVTTRGQGLTTDPLYAGQQQGGTQPAAGGQQTTTANPQGDTVQIGGMQVPTSFSNHGQEVSWAAHHGIHGTDLSQIAGGGETVQQYLQNQQNNQTAPATTAKTAGGDTKPAAAGATQPAAAGTNNGLTTFLTNLMNEIKAFLAQQPTTQPAATQPAATQPAATQPAAQPTAQNIAQPPANQ